jgi:hypothetical protein
MLSDASRTPSLVVADYIPGLIRGSRFVIRGSRFVVRGSRFAVRDPVIQ